MFSSLLLLLPTVIVVLPGILGKNDSVTVPKLQFVWLELLNMDEPKIVTGNDFEFPIEF